MPSNTDYEPFEITREDGCKIIGQTNKLTNKIDGEYNAYYANGTLWFTANYEGGLRNGPYCEYYEDGQLERECGYKDSEYHGPYKQYYEEGGLCIDTTYEHGERQGAYKEYYRNGVLAYLYLYDNGVRINNALAFTEDGSRKAITHFTAAGKLTKKTTFYASSNIHTIICYDSDEFLTEVLEYYDKPVTTGSRIQDSAESLASEYKWREQQFKDGKCIYSATWTEAGDLIS